MHVSISHLLTSCFLPKHIIKRQRPIMRTQEILSIHCFPSTVWNFQSWLKIPSNVHQAPFIFPFFARRVKPDFPRLIESFEPKVMCVSTNSDAPRSKGLEMSLPEIVCPIGKALTNKIIHELVHLIDSTRTSTSRGTRGSICPAIRTTSTWPSSLRNHVLRLVLY